MFRDTLPTEDKQFILDHSISKDYQANTILYHNTTECPGLIIMKSGQARAFIHSPSSNECFSPHNSLTFDLQIEFKKESQVHIIPKHIYQELATTITL